ncbi:dihydrofolate reductase family protein [Agromyces sp. ISL-38]|nr:dihydrofolate reductase family protein [Agromyces sp. ISL-38]
MWRGRALGHVVPSELICQPVEIHDRVKESDHGQGVQRHRGLGRWLRGGHEPTGLLDELRLHVTPCVLGAGERVFDGVPPQALERVSVRAASLVTHITYRPVRA